MRWVGEARLGAGTLEASGALAADVQCVPEAHTCLHTEALDPDRDQDPYLEAGFLDNPDVTYHMDLSDTGPVSAAGSGHRDQTSVSSSSPALPGSVSHTPWAGVEGVASPPHRPSLQGRVGASSLVEAHRVGVGVNLGTRSCDRNPTSRVGIAYCLGHTPCGRTWGVSRYLKACYYTLTWAFLGPVSDY